MRAYQLASISLSLLVTSVACFDGGGIDDGFIDDEDPTPFIAPISGSVIDWETGTPVAGATVVVDSGWLDPAFPTEGDGFASLTTNSEGRFGPVDVILDSRTFASIVLLRVSGADVAPTASDQRLECDSSGEPPYRCEAIDHTIVAPSVAVNDAWRSQLEADEINGAADLGLVLFEYRETDGAPAVGVEGQVADFFDDGGGAVRYLDDDGMALAKGATTTTASGLALFAPLRESALVSGKRGNASWRAIGVLSAPGWIFVEDRTVSQ